MAQDLQITAHLQDAKLRFVVALSPAVASHFIKEESGGVQSRLTLLDLTTIDSTTGQYAELGTVTATQADPRWETDDVSGVGAVEVMAGASQPIDLEAHRLSATVSLNITGSEYNDRILARIHDTIDARSGADVVKLHSGPGRANGSIKLGSDQQNELHFVLATVNRLDQISVTQTEARTFGAQFHWGSGSGNSQVQTIVVEGNTRQYWQLTQVNNPVNVAENKPLRLSFDIAEGVVAPIQVTSGVNSRYSVENDGAFLTVQSDANALVGYQAQRGRDYLLLSHSEGKTVRPTNFAMQPTIIATLILFTKTPARSFPMT